MLLLRCFEGGPTSTWRWSVSTDIYVYIFIHSKQVFAAAPSTQARLSLVPGFLMSRAGKILYACGRTQRQKNIMKLKEYYWFLWKRKKKEKRRSIAQPLNFIMKKNVRYYIIFSSDDFLCFSSSSLSRAEDRLRLMSSAGRIK